MGFRLVDKSFANFSVFESIFDVWAIDQVVTGQRRSDTTDVMLDYVGYALADLRSEYRKKVQAARLPDDEAAQILAALEAGMTGYTYLNERDG